MARLHTKRPPYPLTADVAALLAITRRPTEMHVSYLARWRSQMRKDRKTAQDQAVPDPLPPALRNPNGLFERALAWFGAATETNRS